MTIASEISTLKTNLQNIYSAINNKGGTVPSNQNYDNLNTSVGTVPSGTSYVEVSNLVKDFRAITNGTLGFPTSTTFTMPNDITIIGNMQYVFAFCDTITTMSFNNVTTINSSGCMRIFDRSTSIQTVTFPSLDSITGNQIFSYAFFNCSTISSISFPALKSTSFGSNTSQFSSMLMGCSDVTVHFPSNLQSVIGSWSDVSYGFDGTNTTILFDLPATS